MFGWIVMLGSGALFCWAMDQDAGWISVGIPLVIALFAVWTISSNAWWYHQ